MYLHLLLTQGDVCMMKKDDSGIDLGKSPDVSPKKKSSSEKRERSKEGTSTSGEPGDAERNSDSETG